MAKTTASANPALARASAQAPNQAPNQAPGQRPSPQRAGDPGNGNGGTRRPAASAHPPAARPVPGATLFQPPPQTRPRDLAQHFCDCGRLGRHLTLIDESRFVITDDFSQGRVADPAAAAMASITSNDVLVAQAALVPLGASALAMGRGERRKIERLFSLIEAHALSGSVRDSAARVRRAGFIESQIHALERELGNLISPARKRYRAFLEVVRKLMDGQVTPTAFRDEFLDFTYAVAGRLDFGIYSFCLDRIFGHPKIPLKVKTFLTEELVKYPPLVRRELLANLLSGQRHDRELIEAMRDIMLRRLDREVTVEIELLEMLKASDMSIDQIVSQLAVAG